MVVGDSSSEKLPGTVVIADIGEAGWLRDTTVGEEVSVGNSSPDTKTANGVATVGVDSFYVVTIIGVQTVGVVVP